jgi:hypothetical protein
MGPMGPRAGSHRRNRMDPNGVSSSPPSLLSVFLFKPAGEAIYLRLVATIASLF